MQSWKQHEKNSNIHTGSLVLFYLQSLLVRTFRKTSIWKMQDYGVKFWEYNFTPHDAFDEGDFYIQGFKKKYSLQIFFHSFLHSFVPSFIHWFILFGYIFPSVIHLPLFFTFIHLCESDTFAWWKGCIIA